MNETIYRASSIEGLVYEPTPSSSVEMEYGAAGFDAAGMRDDEEHALAPDPARTRVAIVGDSIVWSEFLPVWDSLPERVEEALGRERYEVLPFGVSGYDTTQEAIWYEHAAALPPRGRRRGVVHERPRDHERALRALRDGPRS